ncbi:tyrosine-type recombinase/integrase [Paenibacillus sp. Z3-2]
MTAGEFKNQFNATAENHSLNQIVIKELSREFNDDSTMTFTYAFDENINMIMKTDKKLKLNEVFIVSNEDITADSGKDTLAVIASTTMTVNPDYGIEDVNELLTRLGWLAENSDPMSFTGSLDDNGVFYKIKSQDNIVTFDIKPSSIETQNSQTTSDAEETENSAHLKESLGVTPEEFKDRFNGFTKELDLAMNIKSLPIDPDSIIKNFEYSFSDDLFLVGTINKESGEVRGISFNGRGDGTTESGEKLLIGAAAVFAATQPDATVQTGGGILKKLGLFEEGIDYKYIDASTILNGLEYRVMSVKAMASYTKIKANNKQGYKWICTLEGPPDPLTGKRKQIPRRGDTQKEAFARAQAVYDQLSRGINAKKNKSLIFEDVAEEWFRVYSKGKVKKRSIITRGVEIKNLNKHFAKRKISSITHRDFQECLYQLFEQGYSFNTISGFKTTANMIFPYTIKNKYILDNPTTDSIYSC